MAAFSMFCLYKKPIFPGRPLRRVKKGKKTAPMIRAILIRSPRPEPHCRIRDWVQSLLTSAPFRGATLASAHEHKGWLWGQGPKKKAKKGKHAGAVEVGTSFRPHCLDNPDGTRASQTSGGKKLPLMCKALRDPQREPHACDFDVPCQRAHRRQEKLSEEKLTAPRPRGHGSE